MNQNVVCTKCGNWLDVAYRAVGDPRIVNGKQVWAEQRGRYCTRCDKDMSEIMWEAVSQ